MAAATHRTAGDRGIFLMFVLLLTALCAVSSCKPGKEKEKEVTRHATPVTDREKLLLIHKLPLGAEYHEVKSCFPGSGPMMASTTTQATADSELVVTVKILERDAALKFAFQRHSLSSYSFSMSMLDSVTASDLNGKLKKFYTMAFGNYHESVEADKDVSTWSAGGTAIQLVARRVDDRFQLFWEFRKSQRPRKAV